jgi:hypothetical protein
VIQTLLPIIGPIIDKLVDRIPDPAAREKARLEAEATLLAASIEEMRGQVEINKVEAGNASVFVAGWRPAIGWSCALAFAFMYVVSPVVVWLGGMFGVVIPQPTFDSDALMSLTFGMLGIAGFRTFEKVKGVARAR